MKQASRLKRRVLLAILVAILVLFAALFALVYSGTIILNAFSARAYPVRGVDVSAYQGEIDWDTLVAQNIQFAFVKATEGSSHVDSRFSYNYAEALRCGLRVGAYHFFSYDSPGITQAENFIAIVPDAKNTLPPVVDVEFYGDKERNPPDAAAVEAELSSLLNALEARYAVKPILYATEKSYRMYIAGRFDEYDIWIRNVLMKPTLSDQLDWTFWQYTNRARLDGYQGEERYIDMNVFAGSRAAFDAYAR